MTKLHSTFAVACMLIASSACDNVKWGGADLAIVPPPPKANALPPSAEDLAADPLPTGPILFYVVPSGYGGVMVPVAEIAGDSMLPLRPQSDPGRYAARLIAANMRVGSEFALYRNGARVGTFVVRSAESPAANACPPLPRAHGTLELSEAAQNVPEYLAISKPHAPDIRRQIAFMAEPTRSMQVIAPILAERMMRARSAPLPGNWGRAMVQLKPFPIANSQNPGFATTFLVGDDLNVGGDNDGYSLFFLGVPGAQFGFDTVYVQYTNYASESKAAPRVVDFLDWNRDGQVELLLQVYGLSSTWFEAVSKKADGRWQRILRDRCDRPGGQAIPTPDTTTVRDTSNQRRPATTR